MSLKVDEHFSFSFVFWDVPESKEGQTERKNTQQRATLYYLPVFKVILCSASPVPHVAALVGIF